jgi:uncharacterized protein
VATLLGCVSLLYGTVGQAGGTAFLAVMAFAAVPLTEMRATALLLNVAAAGYATWRWHRNGTLDRRLVPMVTVPSVATAFVGGLLVLGARAYATVTGILLVAAAGLMALKRGADTAAGQPPGFLPAAMAGAGAGFVSGLTGVGGGVFLTPLAIALNWVSPRHAAALAPPFILCNSLLGFAGVLLAGQRVAPGTPFYAAGVLAGAVLGTAIGQRWMSHRAVRHVLAVILLFAGIRLLVR